MPLNKASGNMYPDISHTINPVSGLCHHRCIYCTTTGNKKPVIQDKYSGDPEIVEHELKVNLGEGRFIFIENMADLFASNVNDEIILEVLAWLNKYPKNRYLLQTKNPKRFLDFIDNFPPLTTLDTTIETDNHSPYHINYSKAPGSTDRSSAMMLLKEFHPEIPRRVTVEPIMKFQLKSFIKMLTGIEPEYVYIGADSNLKCRDCSHEFRYRKAPVVCPKCRSKNITNSDNIHEPFWEEVIALIRGLLEKEIPIIKKENLNRLMIPAI